MDAMECGTSTQRLRGARSVSFGRWQRHGTVGPTQSGGVDGPLPLLTPSGPGRCGRGIGAPWRRRLGALEPRTCALRGALNGER
jgi:hypothetical protein